MDRVRGNQGHITVDAATGIPAAGGNVVDRLDSHNVLCDSVAGDLVGDIKCKGGIAVVVLPYQGTVDIDISVGIDAVKVQEQGLAGGAFRQSEGFPVPAGAAGQEAGFRLAGGGIALTDAEIVGQGHGFPAGIVKTRILRRGGSAEIELPAFVEIRLSLSSCIGADCDSFRFSGDSGSCRKRGSGQKRDYHQQRQKNADRTVELCMFSHTFPSFLWVPKCQNPAKQPGSGRHN